MNVKFVTEVLRVTKGWRAVCSCSYVTQFLVTVILTYVYVYIYINMWSIHPNIFSMTFYVKEPIFS